MVNHPNPPSSKASQNTTRRPMIIGQARNSSLKASKTLFLAKSVYRLGNIDAEYTVEDITNHLESMGVRVISCYERKSENPVFKDNTSFRVCIIDADKEAFLNGANWSVGISIQRWVFKPKVVSNQDATTGTVAPLTAGNQSDRRTSMSGPQSFSSMTGLSQTGAAADRVTVGGGR